MKLRLINTLLLGVILCASSFADVLTLKKDHPKTYTVVKGDTLWDISTHFLNTPWLWPRLWQANSQIENPHLIYPGDRLTLIWLNGEPRIMRKQLKKLSPIPRLAEKKTPIPTIPLTAISAFLSKDHVINSALLANAPRLLGDAKATPRFFEGDIFYGEGKYNKQTLYGIYHLGNNYLDPDTHELLGTALTFVGNAQVSKNPNVSATDMITPLDFLKSSREARQGDLILAIPEHESLPAFFLPQPVPNKLWGNIIATLNNTVSIGKGDVVVINKGNRENIKIGSMFSILRSGPNVLIKNKRVVYQKDASKLAQLRNPDFEIPAERVGELMVFKVYDKVSLALVMRSSDIMATNYKIQGIEF